VFLFGYSFLFGQDTTLYLHAVDVVDSLRHLYTEKVPTIRRAQILELQAEDIGQLAQKIAGVQVKSYGGLGGLKTLSVRGLGSQHATILVDGFSLQNAQTGQINLGALQSENIESMQLVIGGQKNELVPASAQVSGSSLYVETFENSSTQKRNRVRFASKIGSFGQRDSYLAFNQNTKSLQWSVYGKLRHANGEYAYTIPNGQSAYAGIRENNAFRDMQTGLSMAWRLHKHGKLTLQLRREAIDQELPGAIILYSQTGSQTLKTSSSSFQSSYLHTFSKISVRFFTSLTSSNLRYSDSTFLNASGILESRYLNELFQGGVSARYALREKLTVFVSTEQQYSALQTSVSGFGVPQRWHNFSLVGVNYAKGKQRYTGQLSTQVISENSAATHQVKTTRINPFFQVESTIQRAKFHVLLTGYFRNSLRMPTFNELYYTTIGAPQLKPETANQFSVGFFISPSSKTRVAMRKQTFLWNNRTNIFRNEVQNKIVSLPTKNLFIWSTQNVGSVRIFGLETSTDFQYFITEKWQIQSTLNYTLQNALDQSSIHSPTYGHQIAYLPKHSYNADISVRRNTIGVRWSTFGNSLRYALNENIPSNAVAAFGVSDLAIFGTITRKQHVFRIQFSVKNMFNSSYSIIRYYVMPGRNYLLTFNYALD
jgi:outer membrane cobalamin receptor